MNAGSNDSIAAGKGGSKTTLLKMPSPPRPGQESRELTFQQKLEEIKRQRRSGTAQVPVDGKTQKRVIINGKPALDMSGDWALMQSSSSGKKYFFNVKTMVNQWSRPKEWLGPKPPRPPALPPDVAAPPPPPRSPSPEAEGGKRFQMKIKHSKLAAVPLNDEEGEPNCKSRRLQSLPNPESEKGKEGAETHSSRSRNIRSTSRSRSRSRSSSYSSRSSHSSEDDEKRKGLGTNPVPAAQPKSSQDTTNSLVMAAKAKIESQMAGMVGVVVVKENGTAEPAILPTPAPPPPPLPQPVSCAPPAPSTLLEVAKNPTWVSEYNFPAMLTRCKFPKKYDAIHEIMTNRTKRRKAPLPIPVDVEDPKGAAQLRKKMFTAELKNSNNRYRLLSDKLGTTVYKIPDELWERWYQQFQIELTPMVKLESRPHGYTEDDLPVYTRTGKVANRMPYQEDIVRCHAVMQSWGADLCHCVYANKTYTIEKDDKQWVKDLDQCRRFLEEEGF